MHNDELEMFGRLFACEDHMNFKLLTGVYHKDVIALDVRTCGYGDCSKPSVKCFGVLIPCALEAK